MKNRIIGFDLARAYAILGMYIVNFNTVFGNHTNQSGLSGFLNLFNGNSSTLFVMLAGMGVSLMSARNHYTVEEKRNIKSTIIKRSWFLFILGVTFCFWWPADILHFYGGYMHIAVFFIFLPNRYYLFAAAGSIVIFHFLLAFIPYETGWDFKTLIYTDFWTIEGFIRNTFYNGWNSIFPWIAYFLIGMYLGRLNWKNTSTPKKVLLVGLAIYLMIFFLQSFATSFTQDKELLFYITADYLPPFLPFMIGTTSFGLILISAFIFIGNKVSEFRIAKVLASTGQMTLTHYISHLMLGLFIFSSFTGKTLGFEMINESPTNPLFILLFSLFYFLFSCIFTFLWLKKFKLGPFELLMRKVSNS